MSVAAGSNTAPQPLCVLPSTLPFHKFKTQILSLWWSFDLIPVIITPSSNECHSSASDAANYMGAPLPTFEVPDEQLVELGATARLFCEAFVGTCDEFSDIISELKSCIGCKKSCAFLIFNIFSLSNFREY